MGPMTGRAAGYCAGYTVPGYMNPYGGRGMGFGGRLGGRGMRFGWGRGFAYNPPLVSPAAYPAAPVVPQPVFGGAYDESAQLEALRNQAQSLEATLSGMQKRIDELEAQSAKKETEG